jgi:hypothetical protein
MFIKKFYRPWLLILLLGATTAALAASAVTPQSFAHDTRIELTGTGPFYQLVLPMAVYRGIEHNDLSDLRVFNGQAEVVPHALLRPTTTSVTQAKETPVPIFPIVGSQDPQEAMALEVKRNQDGTLISLRTSTAAAKPAGLVRGVVLDTSRIKGDIRALHLTIGASTTPFHALSVETSNDLQQWRSLNSDAQLVRLEHAGQRIEKTTVDWDSPADKYVRVLWQSPDTAPAITSASVLTEQTAFNRAPMLWSDPLSPQVSKNDTYEYTLPGRLPLEQLRIGLAQPNTLAPLHLQRFIPGRSRRHPGGWESLTQTVVFRLDSPQGEVTSPDITLNHPAVDRLRLVVDGRSGGLGNTPPTLQIGFVPHILVFLPRGVGPYTLAWGSPSIKDAALSVSTLVPGYRPDQALAASPAVLPSLVRSEPSSGENAARVAETAGAPKTLSKGVLWVVLMIGLLVLAGMAVLLVRQIKQGDGAKG